MSKVINDTGYMGVKDADIDYGYWKDWHNDQWDQECTEWGPANSCYIQTLDAPTGFRLNS